MNVTRAKQTLSFTCVLAGAMACLLVVPSSGQSPAAKALGTVKSVTGNSLVITTDNGSTTTITFADSARIVRATPGQTDVKSATPIQVADIQVGDRIAARGQAGEANTLTASFALVMKKGDIAEKQQQERDQWRKGTGGLVKEVNPSAGTITIANSLAAAGKPIVIHVSPQTDVRRYSADSVKFEDAKPSTLEQIKPGDQVRARGTKNADGTEFTADAIVSGAFRDIAGTVVSTDATNNNITITDLANKKPITIKIGPDSTLRKMPQFMAMGIAMRLKGGGMPGAGAGTPGSAPPNGAPGSNGAAGGFQGRSGGQGHAGTGAQGSAGAPGGFGGFRGGNGGPPDFQQMLGRLPAVSLSELNKGDAVILVATEGSSGSGPTAITLLSGVEPILTAAPPGMNAAATMLSPWNLGGGAPGGGGEGGLGQ